MKKINLSALVFVLLIFCQRAFAITNHFENIHAVSCLGVNLSNVDSNRITPNNFIGTDTERIRAAIKAAKKSAKILVIPQWNSNGTNIWMIDSVLLLPSNLTLVLDNCIIQLSDSSRDNMFRSDNVDIGISDVTWNKNITIVGIGNPILRGAKNPRATGDGHKVLVKENSRGHVSYGSDAGKTGRKQTGDWRNIMILIAYVDNIKIKNINIENSHAFAMSFERVLNGDISNITFNLPLKQVVDDRVAVVHNRDGINLRRGCKNFRINNISGYTQDDFIALSNFAFNVGELNHTIGSLENTTLITSPEWSGPQDNIEDIFINNITCQSLSRAVAIRAADSACIQNVYITNILAKVLSNTVLVGGKGYGKPSLPGKINNINIMNLMGNGETLILIESPIANCTFMNGIYTGDQVPIVRYNINKSNTKNIKEINLVKADDN